MLEREDAGVVAVRPDRVQPVGADQLDVRELVLARAQLRVGREAPAKPGLSLAGRARTGSTQRRERDPLDGAVVPLDEEGVCRLVVVEPERFGIYRI